MRNLADLGERKIIEVIKKLYDYTWVDDDASYISYGNRYLLITTDSISKSSHIPLNVDPILIGYFFAALNLSDIAAMGGAPRYFMTSFTFPSNLKIEYLKKLELGIAKCLNKHKVKMIGGDLKEGLDLTMTGIVMGTVPKSRILKRENVKLKDLVCVTNLLGKNAAGYYLWKLRGSQKGARLLLEIEPRIHEGQLISKFANAAMDLSDGVYSSIFQLKNLTGYGFEIDYSKIPVHPIAKKVSDNLNISIEELALNYGGEYELLFTISTHNYRKMEKIIKKKGLSITVIGKVKKGKNVLIKEGRKIEIKKHGYEHFSRSEILAQREGRH